MDDDAMSITLRSAQPDDDSFLFRVYASTRADEMAAWGWNATQQEAFLRMQFTAQQLSYAGQYPDADKQMIVLDDEPIGRLLVNRSETEILLVDIALLSEYRNAGVGTSLVQGLQGEATDRGVPVRLHVLKSNPAARLYRRLGFSEIGDDGIYLEMKWIPGA